MQYPHKHPDFLRVLTLRTIGNFLILFSLFTMIKTFYEPVKGEISYYFDKVSGKQYLLSDSPEAQDLAAKGKLADLVRNNKVQLIQPKDPDFSIVIPAIAANAKVLPNVNAADEAEYLEALKRGVAHAANSNFPGENGHIFLFAHSTDYFWNVSQYNAVFYLLYKLKNDDEVNVFYKGKRFTYKVVGQQIVYPSEVEYLTRKTDGEFLTLQTCWPPGTTLQRLLVFAKREVE